MIKRRTFGILAVATLAAPSIVRAQTVLKVGLIPSEDSRAMLAQLVFGVVEKLLHRRMEKGIDDADGPHDGLNRISAFDAGNFASSLQ